MQLRAAAYARGNELLARMDYRARLHEVHVPTLIMAGARDFVFPVEDAARPLTAIPGSELVVLEHSNHYPFIDEPEASIALLRTWLAARA